MAVGILGGAFDPPHNGHVALARAAVEQLGLERLLVLVVAAPGHKEVSTPADVRLELARLAFASFPEAVVELDRHARTVDSLEERRLDDALFVLGGDELADFSGWKRPERVLELVRLAVARRPGVPEAEIANALVRLPSPDRVVLFALEAVPVSSSEIRARVRQGEPIDDLVPEDVATAIARLGLYGGPE
jgi:nicotinate-nucleotide adenylyltransferase